MLRRFRCVQIFLEKWSYTKYEVLGYKYTTCTTQYLFVKENERMLRKSGTFSGELKSIFIFISPEVTYLGLVGGTI